MIGEGGRMCDCSRIGQRNVCGKESSCDEDHTNLHIIK